MKNVGLVKQTMTTSTSIISELTTSEERTHQLSQLGASLTLAFIIGPSLGDKCALFIYKYHI